MGREDPQLKLRLSEEMKDHIVKAARTNNRSVNAEIVARLEVSMGADRLEWKEENLVSEMLKELSQNIKETKYQTKVMSWMVEQHQAALRMLEAIAGTDGNLKPEFMDRLRTMLANRGSAESDFPKHPDEN